MKIPRAWKVVLAAGLLATVGSVHSACATAPERSTSLPSRPAASALVTARALSRSLAGGHTGAAAVSYTLENPMGGPARTITGRVRVETPDRVRLDFSTGEKITLRSDGGEWLQPATRQLLRISPDRAAEALLWWRVLLPGSGEAFREDSLGGRRYRLTKPGSATGVTVTARLDARGFPAELVVEGLGESPVTYRISGWRFGPAQSAAAFRIHAPAGYETVDLP